MGGSSTLSRGVQNNVEKAHELGTELFNSLLNEMRGRTDSRLADKTKTDDVAVEIWDRLDNKVTDAMLSGLFVGFWKQAQRSRLADKEKEQAAEFLERLAKAFAAVERGETFAFESYLLASRYSKRAKNELVRRGIFTETPVGGLEFTERGSLLRRIGSEDVALPLWEKATGKLERNLLVEVDDSTKPADRKGVRTTTKGNYYGMLLLTEIIDLLGKKVYKNKGVASELSELQEEAMIRRRGKGYILTKSGKEMLAELEGNCSLNEDEKLVLCLITLFCLRGMLS